MKIPHCLVWREDAIDLAAAILNRGDIDSLEATEAQVDELDRQLLDAFNLDIEQLAALAGALLPLIDVGKSPLTGNRFKGFSRETATPGQRSWICKMPIPA